MLNRTVNHKRLLYALLFIALLGLCLHFIPLDGPGLTELALKRRGQKLLAYFLVAIGLSFSTISFQTLVGNRLLTPGILGIESLYVLMQSLYLWFYWRFVSQTYLNPLQEFMVVMLIQAMFFGLLQPAIKKLLNQGFLMILLICMALGTLFRSLSTFIQVLMEPSEYEHLQSSLFPSFQRINTEVMGLVAILLAVLTIYLWRRARVLDVLHLGRDTARVLGVDVAKEEKRLLWVIVLMTSAVTAMVGPLVYLGFLVANLTYQVSKTYRHQQLFLLASVLAFLIFVYGQLLVEEVFQFNMTISMVVELLGGLFFFYLIYKERRL